MQSPYPHLLTPLVRRGIVIRNRMGMSRAYPPFSTGVESTEVRESLIPYAQYMARNGAAIVTLPSGRGQNPDSRPMKQPFPPPEPAGSGAEPPDPFAEGGGPPPPGAMGGPDLSIANVKLTYIHAVQAIHDQGSLAMGSLMELEPSGWEFDEIPAEALDRLTTLFASRCRLYRDLGFDGAGFYMCYNSSLLAKSLSRQCNHRQDRYGVPTALAKEAFEKARLACGNRFLLELQVSGEAADGGYSTEDLGGYLRAWAPLIDIVQLRAPTVESAHPIGLNSTPELPLTLQYARVLKSMDIDVLLAPIGGFQDPAQNEAFLAQGMADMIYMARAFLCDPGYYQKILEGRGTDVTPCIRCNKCHTKPAEPNPGCSVNPLLQKQLEPGFLPPKRTSSPKQIAVIGGGPAGMQAALTAASLGHQVTLFEKEAALGGQLRFASAPDFKWPVRKFLEHLETQLQKAPVAVRCGTAATPALLAQSPWDAIWIATGAQPTKPELPGLDQRRTYTALEVLGGTLPAGRHVAVVGGAETGTETALYLARAGYQVTLLTRQRQAAHNAHDVHYREICEEYWRSEPRLTILTQAETTGLTPSGLTYLHSGTEHTLTCDDIVLCGYMEPVLEGLDGYAALALQIRVLGDCRKPGDIRCAIRDGFSAAVTLI